MGGNCSEKARCVVRVPRRSEIGKGRRCTTSLHEIEYVITAYDPN